VPRAPREILVVANRTLGGAPLLDRRPCEGGPEPDALSPGRAAEPALGRGLVIYDEAVRESAQVRVDLALSAVAAEGIEAVGEGRRPRSLPGVTMDAVGERRPTEDHRLHAPGAPLGWLRRDLVERIENASGLPVKHVVVDLDNEGPAVQGDARDRQQDLDGRRS